MATKKKVTKKTSRKPAAPKKAAPSRLSAKKKAASTSKKTPKAVVKKTENKQRVKTNKVAIKKTSAKKKVAAPKSILQTKTKPAKKLSTKAGKTAKPGAKKETTRKNEKHNLKKPLPVTLNKASLIKNRETNVIKKDPMLSNPAHFHQEQLIPMLPNPEVVFDLPSDNGEVFDETDWAQMQQLAEQSDIARRAMLLNMRETHPAFNGKNCIECGIDIPLKRLEQGRIRCVDCQNDLEQEKARKEGRRAAF